MEIPGISPERKMALENFKFPSVTQDFLPLRMPIDAAISEGHPSQFVVARAPKQVGQLLSPKKV